MFLVLCGHLDESPASCEMLFFAFKFPAAGRTKMMPTGSSRPDCAHTVHYLCVIDMQRLFRLSRRLHFYCGGVRSPPLVFVHRATAAAAAIGIPVLVWAWNRHVRYWYYAFFPIAYPGDVVPNRLERRYGKQQRQNPKENLLVYKVKQRITRRATCLSA